MIPSLTQAFVMIHLFCELNGENFHLCKREQKQVAAKTVVERTT